MALTRMEAKQRPHKRWQAAVELLDSEAPNYTTIQNSIGRVQRPDWRGFPNFAGMGLNIAVVVFDDTP